MKRRTDRLVVADLARDYRAGVPATVLAARHRVSPWAVYTRLRAAGVHVRTTRPLLELACVETVVCTFREFCDGLLLGDGRLDAQGFLLLEQSLRRAGWLRQIHGLWKAFGGIARTLNIQARDRSIEGRVVHGGPTRLLFTRCYEVLRKERSRWYPDGHKRVPRDIKLTAFVVAHWFCGDGTYTKNGQITFCTQAFSRGDVVYLAARLAEDLGVEARPGRASNGKWRLNVAKIDEARRLGEMMRPYMPRCCFYKLRYLRRAKFTFLLPDQVRELRCRARAGEAVGDLARVFGRGRTAVYRVIAGTSYSQPPKTAFGW